MARKNNLFLRLLPLALGVFLPLRAQDPLKTLPDNYRLVLENEAVRVIRVTYRPHEKLPIHDHPKTPTIYVYLSDSGPVRFSHVEKESFAIDRKPLKTGTFRVSPGRVEIHRVENLGDVTSEFLRIELRQVPLGFQNHSFRYTQPIRLDSSSVSEEFRAPPFHIERVTALGSGKVELADAGAASLLIAFAPAMLSQTSVVAGDVRWLPPARQVAVRAASDGPAHLLRVVFSAGR